MAKKNLSALQAKILDILRKHGEVRPPEIIRASGNTISVGSIHTTLNRLNDKGYVKYRLPKLAVTHTWSITAAGTRELTKYKKEQGKNK